MVKGTRAGNRTSGNSVSSPCFLYHWKLDITKASACINFFRHLQRLTFSLSFLSFLNPHLKTDIRLHNFMIQMNELIYYRRELSHDFPSSRIDITASFSVDCSTLTLTQLVTLNTLKVCRYTSWCTYEWPENHLRKYYKSDFLSSHRVCCHPLRGYQYTLTSTGTHFKYTEIR